MKRLITICIFALMAGIMAFAEVTDPGMRFDQAITAYDQGDYNRASQLFEQLIDNGFESVELFYNGANAAFRKGDVGEAVLRYRQAWYLAPRDPDVQANLQLALQRTGALQPQASIADHFFQELSHREWTGLLRIAYWIVIIMSAAAVFSAKLRRFAKPAAVVAGFAALIGLGGWYYWYNWQRAGEAVVVETKQTALYEPRQTSTPFFALPEGSIVRIEDTFDNWVKVRVNGDAGWVPASVVQRVFSWITQ